MSFAMEYIGATLILLMQSNVCLGTFSVSHVLTGDDVNWAIKEEDRPKAAAGDGGVGLIGMSLTNSSDDATSHTFVTPAWFLRSINGVDLEHEVPFMTDLILRTKMIGDWQRFSTAPDTAGFGLGVKPWQDRVAKPEEVLERIRASSARKLSAGSVVRNERVRWILPGARCHVFDVITDDDYNAAINALADVDWGGDEVGDMAEKTWCTLHDYWLEAAESWVLHPALTRKTDLDMEPKPINPRIVLLLLLLGFCLKFAPRVLNIAFSSS